MQDNKMLADFGRERENKAFGCILWLHVTTESPLTAVLAEIDVARDR